MRARRPFDSGAWRDSRRCSKAASSLRMGLCLMTLVGLAASGCSRTRSFTPSVDPQQLRDSQFVHYLATVPTVTYGEACRAMLIAADGSVGNATTYAAQQEILAERGIVRTAWGLGENACLDLGTLAFMACAVADVPESVNSVLMGSWGLGDRRYAVPRAADADLIQYGVDYELVSGTTIMLTLARIDDYLARRGNIDGPPKIDRPADVAPESNT